MERLKIDYQIRVDKIKRESFLFFIGFWVLGPPNFWFGLILINSYFVAYVFLLTMSNLGLKFVYQNPS